MKIFYKLGVPLILLISGLFALKENPFLKSIFIDALSREFLNTDNKDEILGLENKVVNRSFSSVVKEKDHFIIYYTNASRNNKSTLRRRKAKKLEDLKFAKSILLFSSEEVNSDQIWMPYVFKNGDNYFMIFTSRLGNKELENHREDVRLAKSKDGVKWDIVQKPILSPELDWEGNEVENWGVIKIGDTFFMSYESRGDDKLTRAIGIAYSTDLINWQRLSKDPILYQNYVYCSAFFKSGEYVYHIVPNNKRFRVYKFKNIRKHNENDFIGYWDPFGMDNQLTLDSPEIITNDITKVIEEDKEFTIIYSAYKKNIFNIALGWNTERKVFSSINDFENNLSMD